MLLSGRMVLSRGGVLRRLLRVLLLATIWTAQESGRTHRGLNGCEREDVTDLLLSGLVMIEVLVSDELLRRRALGSNWCLSLKSVC